jgi:hypothetical protein
MWAMPHNAPCACMPAGRIKHGKVPMQQRQKDQASLRLHGF